MTDDTTASGSGPDTADDGNVRCDRRLLEFLVCPLTKGPLTYDPVTQELISKNARLAYPIRKGVPLMTVDSARQLDG
jgi:uncharacterized protein